MVGRKGSTVERPPSKAALPSKQHNLFHFYQKQPKLRDGGAATSTSGNEAAASNSCSGSVSQPPVLIEVIHTIESVSENVRRSPITETNGTIPENIENMGVPRDLLCLSPCMDPPSGRTGNALGEPGELGKASDSGNLTLHPSEPYPAQSVIAATSDDGSTAQGIEAHKTGSFSQPLKRTLHTEVAGASDIVEVPPASSRDVGDDSALAEQAPSSSNPYKASSPGRQVQKKSGGMITVPRMIDLTESQDDPRARSSAASAKQRHVYVIDDDDDEGVTKNTASGSQNTPIDLSSPTKSQSTRVIHPFFARHVPKEQKDKHASISSSTTNATRHMQIPWPGADDQHTTGPQTSFSSNSVSMFSKYRKIPVPFGSPILSTLRWLNAGSVQASFTDAHATGMEPRTLNPLERETVVSSLPSPHREHPGISRILDGLHGNQELRSVEDGGEMWSQRWRPRRAEEVLGNEDNALYLKAWLQALALRACDKPQMGATSEKGKVLAQDHNGRTRRPTIVRAVVKKRGRKRRRIESDDGFSVRDWMVDEEEAVESQSSSGDDDSVSSSSTPGISSHPPRGPHLDVVGDPSSTAADGIRFADFSTLTNTILLAGPPGSGKSSTIYACAEELGWEVFEVHPGIGRRSGGSISSLIGDVGKNHHVGRRGAYNTYTKSVSNRPGFGYLAKERENEENTYLEGGEKVIRQSVILLDEVDVLFKEDANFWPTVMNIIKFSHRPIFMTCNDISLIPQDDLPLQTCLHFQPCPLPLAVSFLQCVCLAEGHFVPQERLEKVYAHTYPLISCDEPEIPPVPFPSQQPPCSDLRQALNTLQFWCSRDLVTGAECGFSTITPGITPDFCSEVLADWTLIPNGCCGDTPEETFDCDMDRIGKHADSASYIDGYLERRPGDVLEALATDSYEPSGDDELGHTLLHKPSVIGKSRGLAFYNRDADMARAALVVSRHVFETSGAGTRARLRGGERGSTRDCRSVVRARVATQALAVGFLDDVMTLSGPLLPRASVVLDYTPYVRHMILADDTLEAEAAAASGENETRQRHRRTRWRMGVHQRHVSISAEGAEAARNMSLGWNV